jgi:hypothetical protein
MTLYVFVAFFGNSGRLSKDSRLFKNRMHTSYAGRSKYLELRYSGIRPCPKFSVALRLLPIIIATKPMGAEDQDIRLRKIRSCLRDCV